MVGEKASSTISIANFLGENPLITIWYRPRVTIRNLIDTTPEKYVIVFAILSGIYRTLSQSIQRGGEDLFSLPWFIFILLIGGAILGIISLYLSGMVLHFTGMSLGGEGQPEHVRTVIAWSSIPDGILLLLYIPVLATGFLFNASEMTNVFLQLIPSLVLFPVAIIFFILRTIIFISGLVEVNGFSIWKAILTVVIGYIVMFIPFICLIGLLSY